MGSCWFPGRVLIVANKTLIGTKLGICVPFQSIYSVLFLFHICLCICHSTCLSVSHNQLSGHVNNLHSLSFFRLLKYTPQDRHSFWPHPSYPLPLRPQIHSSSSASSSSSCAVHSSLATKNWLTLHRATADPLWPFSPSAAQQLDFASTQTPTQEKQHREAGSVLRAGSEVLTSAACSKSRELMVGHTPTGYTQLSWTKFNTFTHSCSLTQLCIHDFREHYTN